MSLLLALQGGAPPDISAVMVGTLVLSGSFAAIADERATLVSTLPLAGSFTAAATDSAQLSGTLALSGGLTAAADERATLSGTLALSGGMVAAADERAVMAGALPLAGSFAAAADEQAVLVGDLALGGGFAGQTLTDITATFDGLLELSGSFEGTVADAPADVIIGGGLWTTPARVSRDVGRDQAPIHAFLEGALILRGGFRGVVEPLPDPAPAWELEPWSPERDADDPLRELVPAGPPGWDDDELLALFHCHEA